LQNRTSGPKARFLTQSWWPGWSRALPKPVRTDSSSIKCALSRL